MADENPIHLGGGAYVTYNGHNYLLTSGHHDPEYSMGAVYLESEALRKLVTFADECEINLKPGG